MIKMNEDVQAVLEALLFTAKEPVSLSDIARILSLSTEETEIQLQALNERYQKDNHGIELKQYDNSYVFATKTEFAQYIEELHEVTTRKKLSKAALETLAIIAYKQPVTRMEIEDIRGVSAERTLTTLGKYDLIEELGRKDTIGNPIVYGTTDEFLKQFDLENISQLPDLKHIEDELQYKEFAAETAVAAEDDS